MRQSPSCWHDDRCKGSMLDFTNSLPISSTVDVEERKEKLKGKVDWTHKYQQASLWATTPKTIHGNVQTSSFLSIQVERWNSLGLLTGCNSGSVHTWEHTSDKRVAVRSLSHYDEAPFRTREHMIHRKRSPTYTESGSTQRRPTVTQSQGILKSDLCRAKPCSFKGRVVSQLEAPFMDANSTACCSVDSNYWRSSVKPL